MAACLFRSADGWHRGGVMQRNAEERLERRGASNHVSLQGAVGRKRERWWFASHRSNIGSVTISDPLVQSIIELPKGIT